MFVYVYIPFYGNDNLVIYIIVYVVMICFDESITIYGLLMFTVCIYLYTCM